MSFFNKDVSVILVDWHNLASFTGVRNEKKSWLEENNTSSGQFDDWDNYAYDYSARNAIDVGEFLGLCLAELSNRYMCSYLYHSYITNSTYNNSKVSTMSRGEIYTWLDAVLDLT